MNTPISTYNAQLKYGSTTSTTNTIDIKSFPSILGQRSQLEVTTMSDGAQKYIQGIRQQDSAFAFTCNWDKTVFSTINALTAAQKCELDFSDGSKFTWDAYLSAAISEGSVDAVIEMTINAGPVSVPVFTAGT